MKALLAKLKALCWRLRYALLGTLAVLLLAVGGAYGWKVYTFRKGPEHAVELLRKALQDTRLDTLAKMVDFRDLSLDMAQNIIAVRPRAAPQARTPEEAQALLAETIQQTLLQSLESARSPDNAKAPIPPGAPLAPLPMNFITQLADGLAIQSTKDGVVFLRKDVEYPRAETTFPLVLLMENRPGWNWVVTRVVNAEELVRMFTAAEDNLQRQRDAAFDEKNALELRLMNNQLRLVSCTAHAQRLSGKNTAILSMEVIGHNIGKDAVHNLNLRVALTGSSVTAEKQVNMAQRINPGENFSYTWNADISEPTPENEGLLQADNLQCSATPHSMTLSSGKLLYIREKSTP